jgi:hypothetical protein
MWFHDQRAGAASAVVVALLCASAAGCALTRGDFVQRDNTPVASTAATSPLEVRPAVLVQEGVPATASTDQAVKAAAANPPPALRADTAPKETKLLSPEEKAKVVAELEALARGQTAGQSAADPKADCAAIAYAKPSATQTVDAASCAKNPKPALRP